MNTNIYSTMHGNKPSAAWRVIPFATAVIIGLLVLQVTPKALALKADHDFGFETLQSTQTTKSIPATKNWKPITITWYGEKYHGRKTASGTRYDRDRITFAVPPVRKGSSRPMVPYGTILTVRYKGHTITGPATDLCPGGTLDCSNAGMRALGFKNLNQKVKGEVSWR